MKPVLVILVLGALAPMIQGVAGAVIPARFFPDLALLFTLALGLCWRGTGGGLLLAASLGYLTDLLSGALLGQHVLLRVLAFGAARLGARQLNLRGPLPLASFAFGLTLANALALGGLTEFFSSGLGGGLAAPADLWSQALINAVCAPFAVRGMEWLLARLSPDESGRRLLSLEPRNWAA